jgi:hypothetical protein
MKLVRWRNYNPHMTVDKWVYGVWAEEVFCLIYSASAFSCFWEYGHTIVAYIILTFISTYTSRREAEMIRFGVMG